MKTVFIVYVDESLRGNTYPPKAVFKNVNEAIELRDKLNLISNTKRYEILEYNIIK